jgi:arylsulfatase A-like enzyme
LRSDLDEAHHSTTWIGDRAVESIQQWQDEGHLLMVGFIKPHHPFDPPAPWHTMYDPALLSLLPGWTETCSNRDLSYRRGYFDNQSLTENKLRRVMAYYYATISQIDHHVGRMIAALKKRGLYDNTIIVYTGDHGEFMGFHHLLLKGNYMYDPLIRVPLLTKYPQQMHAGTTSRDLVSNVDVAPTLLRQTGCPIPQTMSGVDLSARDIERDTLFAEAAQGQQYMVRTRKHKLLICRNGAHSQFFDLTQDPLETTNLFADPSHQHQIAELRCRLLDWMIFDCPSPTHLDLCAPIIGAGNVPATDDGHVQQGIDYYRTRMSQPFEFHA